MKLNKELRVAISGKSGCGNTTVSGMLAKTLGVTLINYTFRQLAAEKGMTLAEVIEAAKTDDSYDKYVDKHQVELALAEPCVLGSRLAIWMLKEADLKVYLLASDDTLALQVAIHPDEKTEQGCMVGGQRALCERLASEESQTDVVVWPV